MPADSTLRVLLDTANAHEELVIRDVAVRAGLLWWCPCDWYSTAAESRCGGCGTNWDAERG